jgi:hypothetical protein
MATRIGGAAAASTTVGIPGSYQAGDLIVLYAFRDGATTEMTDPTNGAWERPKTNAGLNGPTCNGQVYWRYALSSSESAPVVGSATGVLLEVWRGNAPYSLMPGAIVASPVASTGTTITYPALPLSRGDGTSYVLRLAGARAATNLTTNTPPGYTAGAGVATEVRSCYAGPTGTDPAAGTQTVSGSSGWNAVSLELMEKQTVCLEAAVGDPGAGFTTASPNVNFSSDYPGWVPKEGDLVLIAARQQGTNAGTQTAINAAPVGWFNPLGGTTYINSSAHAMAFCAHFVTAAEELAATKSYTATNMFTGSSGVKVTLGFVLRGVDPTTPMDSVATQVNTGTTATIPGLTGANLSNGSFTLGFFGSGTTIGSWINGTAPTNSVAVHKEGSFSEAFFYGDLTAAGVSIADMTRTVTSTTWLAATLAFTQAPPPPPANANFFALF